MAPFNTLFHGLLDRGVYIAPALYEAGFVSAAHSDADIAETFRWRASSRCSRHLLAQVGGDAARLRGCPPPGCARLLLYAAAPGTITTNPLHRWSAKRCCVGRIQCRKWRTPRLNTMATPRSLAASMTSWSRIEPPGWITQRPASTTTSRPSRNGKKASLATGRARQRQPRMPGLDAGDAR
jgi:hypothetical protein